MAYKNMVSVKVCGRTMTLTGNESVEYITKVANYIEEKAALLRSSDNSRNLSATMVSVLTSINIADDYFKSLDEIEKLKKMLPADIDTKTGESAEYVTKATLEELKLLREENERLKKEAEETSKNIETAKRNTDSLLNEKETLLSKLEALKARFDELDQKAKALEDDNIKKIAQINHLKSMESRFLEYERKYNPDRETQSIKETKLAAKPDKAVMNEAAKDDDTEVHDGQEQKPQPFHMNNARLKKVRTNSNYYRHI